MLRALPKLVEEKDGSIVKRTSGSHCADAVAPNNMPAATNQGFAFIALPHRSSSPLPYVARAILPPVPLAASPLASIHVVGAQACADRRGRGGAWSWASSPSPAGLHEHSVPRDLPASVQPRNSPGALSTR